MPKLPSASFSGRFFSGRRQKPPDLTGYTNPIRSDGYPSRMQDSVSNAPQPQDAKWAQSAPALLEGTQVCSAWLSDSYPSYPGFSLVNRCCIAITHGSLNLRSGCHGSSILNPLISPVSTAACQTGRYGAAHSPVLSIPSVQKHEAIFYRVFQVRFPCTGK